MPFANVFSIERSPVFQPEHSHSEMLLLVGSAPCSHLHGSFTHPLPATSRAGEASQGLEVQDASPSGAISDT